MKLVHAKYEHNWRCLVDVVQRSVELGLGLWIQDESERSVIIMAARDESWDKVTKGTTNLRLFNQRVARLYRVNRARLRVHIRTPLKAEGCKFQPIPQPPLNAELALSILLPRNQQEAAIGDFAELFAHRFKRLGRRRAWIWAWAEVLKVALPSLKRALLQTSGTVAAAEWMRRHLS